MRVICPLVACASVEKRDKFMNLLRDIADLTLSSEPKTLAYGWFSSVGFNDRIPDYWVRGFEVYQDEEAHLQIHRASAQYKKMREMIGQEELLTQPIELRILQPCGIGFLSKEKYCIFQGHTGVQQIVVTEYSPTGEQKIPLLQALQRVAQNAASNEQTTLTFWVLEHTAKQNNEDVVLLARFVDKAAYNAHNSSTAAADLRSVEQRMSVSVRVTHWEESGIGFINRESS